MMQLPFFSFVLAAALVALAGCGGGGSGDTAPGNPGPVASEPEPAPPDAPPDIAAPSPEPAPEEPSPPAPPDTGTGATDPCALPHLAEIGVQTAPELAAALEDARPGTLIRLRPGTYAGHFKATASGTRENPVVLCGPRTAVLDGGDLRSGYVLYLSGADHWILSGFTLTRGKKGLVLDRSNQNLLTALLVHDLGEEAVHFRKFSSDNTLSDSEVRNIGKVSPGYGEAVYIGSAVSHWKAITGSGNTPDRSDGNLVLGNVLGPGVTAELVDIKEGTAGGEVRSNTFNGSGISGVNYADSWMDVKGSGYLIADNVGRDARNDGFQTHIEVAGWGNNNIFENNHAAVNGPGYGFWVHADSTGNIVRCDNSVQAAAKGFANVTCVR
jgi:hypothetical protein